MSYITFRNHPSDLIKSQYKKNKLESFLIIGDKQIQIHVDKISFLGKNIFKVYCTFPAYEIESQYAVSILRKMLYDNEIIEFEL